MNCFKLSLYSFFLFFSFSLFGMQPKPLSSISDNDEVEIAVLGKGIDEFCKNISYWVFKVDYNKKEKDKDCIIS